MHVRVMGTISLGRIEMKKKCQYHNNIIRIGQIAVVLNK